uniref:Deoxyribonuclease TATDN3, TatD-related deoxyribonuclease. Similar to peotein in Homo sapiens (Human), which belongs to the tatD DNase family n=1 Tax=Magnetococcus massalia (strain MO-1) TaxID=451514 RepID=A0A1S7LLX1_MAGMO|nr:Deoxyribonuclease TATDN3, TatD-related deoxyribonuclease. Similar to peotein in Homo sapiens (Human), which belongs to the tatD DNase family [Candidatus Magnetococcus massalia]
MIDTHAHICDDRFDGDRTATLARATEAGVEAIIAVSETLVDAQRNLELAERFPQLRLACGLYPGYADLDAAEAMIPFMRAHADRWVAVGEVGLDYALAREPEQRAVQAEVLRRFALLAHEFNIPLNVHSRSAGRDVIEKLLGWGAVRVQMHAYHGPHKPALKAVEAGYFFSIPPSVMRSGQMRELVAKLPLSCLLLESDSPVLGPEAEVRNEPGNIARSVPVIAEVKGVSEAEVLEKVRENTIKLYGDVF